MKTREYDIKTDWNKNTGLLSIVIEGNTGIGYIEEIRKKINPDRNNMSQLDITLKDLVSFDLSTFQLLWSLERTMKNKGISVKIVADLPANDTVLLNNCGLGNFIHHWINNKN